MNPDPAHSVGHPHGANSHVFLDSLENLAGLLVIVLQHAQEAEQEFLINSNRDQTKQFEKSVTQVRMCAEQLERQFNRLEYVLTKHHLSD